MNSSGRYMISLFLGFSAALLGWSVLELCLSLQTAFPSYTVLLLSSGALTGAAMTAVLASLEGILHKDAVKIHSEWSLGLLWGLIGGALGAMGGQVVYTMISPDGLSESTGFILYAARISSWAFMGAFIGTAEGLRSRSTQKISAGLISGILAGIMGGAIVESAMILFPDDSWLKLPGFMIIGIGTAVLTIFIEEKTSPGVFRVLNGASKGRKYLLNQQKITVGSKSNCDISLKGSEDVAPIAAILKRQGKEVIIDAASQAILYVNDEKCETVTLKYEDVIQIGKFKFLYEVNQ